MVTVKISSLMIWAPRFPPQLLPGRRQTPPPKPRHSPLVNSSTLLTLWKSHPSRMQWTKRHEINYKKYISTSIHEQVGENVREWYKNSGGPPPDAELPFSRCVVCTLPFGSCVHTRDWLQYTAPESRAKSRGEWTDDNNDTFDPTSALLGDMEDVLAVGKDELHSELKKGIRTKALPLTYISNMHWTKVLPPPADNINGNELDISSPPAQGGITALEIHNSAGQPHLVVCGGIRYPNNGVFLAYSSTLIGSKQVGIYEDRVFRVLDGTTDVARCNGRQPGNRCATRLCCGIARARNVDLRRPARGWCVQRRDTHLEFRQCEVEKSTY